MCRKKLIVVVSILLLVAAVTWATVTANFNVALNITHTSELDWTTLRDVINETRGAQFTDGTGANQIDTLWHDYRTLADDANDTLDLHTGTDDAGAITDSFGTTLTLDAVKVIYIRNTSADATLEVGGAVATQLGLFKDASDIIEIPPGGDFLWTSPSAAGLDVTTNECLKVAHDGTGSSTLIYHIIVGGED